LYKEIVYETLEFIQRELTSDEGAFYSALDADSEGMEGKFYVWKKEELEEILKEKFDLFAEYYNVNQEGFWEEENYILLRKETDEQIAGKFAITQEKLKEEIKNLKSKLLAIRERRVKPGLDDKSLTSWNALMVKGYVDAYNAFEEKKFLDAGIRNAEFILSKQLRKDGGLNHSYKNGKSSINGYLEDYAFVIEAFISLYDCTFEEKWLNAATQLIDYNLEHFYDNKSGMFFFTSDLDTALIARKMEIADNVTPASNSSLARSLFVSSHLIDKPEYLEISGKMLNNVQEQIADYLPAYSNWAMLMLNFISPFYEVAIVGKHVDEKRRELGKHYLPNRIFAGTKTKSDIALLRDKPVSGDTMIYICEGKSCLEPVDSVQKALLQMKNK
jgi:uncharacterized protein